MKRIQFSNVAGMVRGPLMITGGVPPSDLETEARLPWARRTLAASAESEPS